MPRDKDKAVRAIIKAHGEGAIRRLSDADVTMRPVIPTGSLNLDLALGVGGLPRGRVTEVFGPEGTGKTTVCLNLVARTQAAGGNSAFIDFENALDLQWAEMNGVDVSQLYVAQPDTAEEGLDIAEKLVRGFDTVVIDSVAGMVPKAELEGEIGDAHMALTARLMGQTLRRFSRQVKEYQCAVVFTNQLRAKIGVTFGKKDDTTGGRALKFFSSVRISLWNGGQIKQGDVVVGNKIGLRVVKNKVAPPFRTAELAVYYDEGLSLAHELIGFGTDMGLIEKGKSGWWTILPGEDGERKVQGEAAVRDVLRTERFLGYAIELGVRDRFGLPVYFLPKGVKDDTPEPGADGHQEEG